MTTDYLPVSDRGCQYGDGLFETLAIRQGRLQYWEAHMQRLAQGCSVLGIPMPVVSELRAEAERLAGEQPDAVLKIMVTRGSGGRGYRSPDNPEPTSILSLHPWPDYPSAWQAEGVCVRLGHLRLARQPVLAGLKHMNRLEQVLARREWRDENIQESLMLDTEDRVIEGVMTNLFMVSNGILRTPDLSQCGVAGVMRGRVIELAEELDILVRVEQLSLVDIEGADELFLTNSLIGIWPVRQLESRSYPVGDITRQLQQAIANDG